MTTRFASKKRFDKATSRSGAQCTLGPSSVLHGLRAPSSFLAQAFVLVLLVASIAAAPAPVSAALSWQVDGSVGYLFVSEAQGPPWFKDTVLPGLSVGFGGGSWLVGASADYARRTTSYQGFVPGFRDLDETVEFQTRNSSFKAFAKFYPSGRERSVATYLGAGIGPAITSVEHTGAITGRKATERDLRLSYSATLGAQLNFKALPFHTFVEGSYGGLGEISDPAEDSMVPAEELTFVSVAAGVGMTF